MLKLCIALLDHKIEADDYGSAFVCGLAAAGMRCSRRGGWWVDLYRVVPILSELMKSARFMVVQEAIK